MPTLALVLGLATASATELNLGYFYGVMCRLRAESISRYTHRCI